MTKQLSIMCILCLLLINTLSAQTISPGELYERGEITMHDGYVPRDMDSLVGSSAIIVKARFMKFIGAELFFGFDRSREKIQRMLNLSDADTDRLGVPISTYEILVDEVLFGDPGMQGKTILFRLNEMLTLENPYLTPTEDRLFFLAENPDGSYAAMGPANIQIAREGRYSYDSLSPNPNEFQGRVLDFVESTDVILFEENIKNVLQRLYGN